MMTYAKIVDEVLRLHYGGNIPADAEFNRLEVKAYVAQAINTLLKKETVAIDNRLGYYFPPHASIMTYTGVAVTAVSDPVSTVVCTPMSTTSFTTGTPTLTVTVNGSGANTYYGISITGISLDGAAMSSIQSFITAAGDSCIVSFIGPDDTVYPVNFLAAGIEDLATTSTTITFNYYPDGEPVNGYWATAEADGWVTGPGNFWGLGETAPPGITVPTLITSYVASTHALLEAIAGSSEVYAGFTFTMVSECCISTNASEIDCTAMLPAQPMHLSKNLGIWAIYPPSNPSNIYIPMERGRNAQASNITHNNLAAVMSDQVTYEWFDQEKVRFHNPVSEVGATVDMQLIVVDPDQLGWTDLLPIPADMQAEVIAMVRGMLQRAAPADVNNDEKDSQQ